MAAGCQAGWASPRKEAEKVPPGPGQSPKCTKEAVGQSGTSLGRPPRPPEGPAEAKEKAEGQRRQP